MSHPFLDMSIQRREAAQHRRARLECIILKEDRKRMSVTLADRVIMSKMLVAEATRFRQLQRRKRVVITGTGDSHQCRRVPAELRSKDDVCADPAFWTSLMEDVGNAYAYEDAQYLQVMGTLAVLEFWSESPTLTETDFSEVRSEPNSVRTRLATRRHQQRMQVLDSLPAGQLFHC